MPGLKNGMDYVKVGTSDLLVSKICMGTMTFGEVSATFLVFGLSPSFITVGTSILITSVRNSWNDNSKIQLRRAWSSSIEHGMSTELIFW